MRHSLVAVAFAAILGCSSLAACGSSNTDGVDDGATGGGGASGGALGSGGGVALTGGTTGSGGGAASGGNGNVPNGPLVMGYILDLGQWGGTAALDQLDYTAIDYVIHAFYTANDSNQLVSVDSIVDDYRNAGLVTKVHAAGKRIVMSLGGANHSYTLKQVAADPTRTAAFVANVVAKINEYGYDGVDLDMEFPAGGNEPQQQLALMTALHAAVKANDASHLVMFGVSPGYYLNQFEWSQLGAQSDYAFYFCYDWNMPANGPMTSPGSSFNMLGGEPLSEASCRAALNYMIAEGYPASQIVVGLPFYASSGARYSAIDPTYKGLTPHADYREVSAGGAWWPTATSTVMKVDAVLDASQSVLTNGATVAGVGYWEWGYENPAAPDLSQAIKARVIDTR